MCLHGEATKSDNELCTGHDLQQAKGFCVFLGFNLPLNITQNVEMYLLIIYRTSRKKLKKTNILLDVSSAKLGPTKTNFMLEITYVVE